MIQTCESHNTLAAAERIHRNAVRLMGRHSDEREWFFDKKQARSLIPDPAAHMVEITTRCVGCMACLLLPPTRHWPCTHPQPPHHTPPPALARWLATLARAGTYRNSGTVGGRYVRLVCFIVLESLFWSVQRKGVGYVPSSHAQPGGQIDVKSTLSRRGGAAVRNESMSSLGGRAPRWTSGHGHDLRGHKGHARS